jgi:hypothetical protein
MHAVVCAGGYAAQSASQLLLGSNLYREVIRSLLRQKNLGTKPPLHANQVLLP